VRNLEVLWPHSSRPKLTAACPSSRVCGRLLL
jgi:hypothetical protein